MAIQTGSPDINSNSMSKKVTRPMGNMSKTVTSNLDAAGGELEKLSHEAAGFASEASSIAQKLISEVKEQGEAVLERMTTLAKEYGVEMKAVRSYVSSTTQKNPVTVVLGAAAIGFAAGYLTKSRMRKPSAE